MTHRQAVALGFLLALGHRVHINATLATQAYFRLCDIAEGKR